MHHGLNALTWDGWCTEVSSYGTQVLDNGRPSVLLPCSNQFYVKHGSHADSTTYLETSKKKGTFFTGSFEDGLGDNVFACTKDDNRSGMSVEDRKFIDIMNSPGMNLVAGRCPYLSVRNLTGFPTTKKMQSNA